MTRNDYGDLSALLISKLQVLETKVDALNQDRVTRSDFENLRKEISGSYVPRDVYESRHANLLDRDTQLDFAVKEVRKDYEAEMKELREIVGKDVQRIHERLESGKQQLEDRIKQQADVQLSHKDRLWLRGSQVIGFVGLAVAVLDWLFQHVKLQ